MRKIYIFLFFFSDFFSDFERKRFQTFGQKTSRICQNYLLRVQRNNLWLYFFFKFWVVSDFLQKPLAWFSKFYLSVQSKNCGRNSFFLFFFSEFIRISSKNFSDFWPKNFMKLSELPSACPEEHFVNLIFFQKFSTVLNFLQKPLAWFSKIYLSVQRKNCGRNFFLFFLPEFFRILSENFFRLLAKKLQEFVKTTFYVSRGTICGLNFYIKFWIVSDFLQKPLARFSKIYLSVQGKNCGKNRFFLFSFQK